MKRIAFMFALAAAATFAASAPKATLGELGLNAQIVTNVDFSGLSVEETDPEFSTFRTNGGTMYGPLKLWNGVGDYDMSTVISSNGVSFWKFMPSSGGGGIWTGGSFAWDDLLTGENDPNVPNWAKQSSKPTYSWSEITGKPSGLDNAVPSTRKVNNKALSSDITLSASDVGAASASDVNTLSQNVTTVFGYLQGDDAKVVITNYDSSTEMPAASFQQKIADNGTNYWRTIWNETTRWNWFLPVIGHQTNALWAALDQKADRAWGYYESHTGNYAPDGYTWIGSPKIAIAANLAYQRTVTSEGAVWVLVSSGLVTETGGNVTNGFFRISDDGGNTLFEIVKGNKRTVGATAAGIKVESSGGTHTITIPYNVVSDTAPTLYGATSLDGEWSQLSPTWISNVSGAYTGVVTSASSRYFVKGEYEVGGDTYIKNTAPISADGGIFCTDGIHKVRPVYNNDGSITWEVVP